MNFPKKTLWIINFFVILMLMNMISFHNPSESNNVTENSKTKKIEKNPISTELSNYIYQWAENDTPSIMFDLSHQSAWSPYDIGYMGMSDLVRLLQQRHFRVGSIANQFTEEVNKLTNLTVLFLNVAKYQSYTANEIEAILNFTYRGGGVFIVCEHDNMFNNGAFQNALLQNYNITVNYNAIKDPVYYIGIEDWILFNSEILNVTNCSFYSSPSFTISGSAYSLANSSSMANPANASIIVANSYGNGKVIAIGDSEIFWNGNASLMGIHYGNNSNLILRCMDYLSNFDWNDPNYEIRLEYTTFTADTDTPFYLNLTVNGTMDIRTSIYGGQITPTQQLGVNGKVVWDVRLAQDGFIKLNFTAPNLNRSIIKTVYFFQNISSSRNLGFFGMNGSHQISTTPSGLYEFAKQMRNSNFSIFEWGIEPPDYSRYYGVIIVNPLANFSDSLTPNLLNLNKICIIQDVISSLNSVDFMTYMLRSLGQNDPDRWINAFTNKLGFNFTHYVLADNVSCDNGININVKPMIQPVQYTVLTHFACILNMSSNFTIFTEGNATTAWGDDISSLGLSDDITKSVNDIQLTTISGFNPKTFGFGDTEPFTNQYQNNHTWLWNDVNLWFTYGKREQLINSFTINNSRICANKTQFEVSGLNLLDLSGQPLLANSVFTIRTKESTVVNPDIDPLSEGYQILSQSDQITVLFESSTTVGSEVFWFFNMTYGIYGNLSVTYYPGSPHEPFTISANRSKIVANGSQDTFFESSVVRDEYNHQVLDGELFTITSDLGLILTSDADGEIPGIQIAVLNGIINFSIHISEASPLGLMNVSVHSFNGSAHELLQLEIISEIPVNPFSFEMEMSSHFANNVQFWVNTSILKDQFNHEISDNIYYFTITTTLGTIESIDAISWMNGIQIPVENHRINVLIDSGTLSGICIITFTAVNGSASNTTQVELLPNWPSGNIPLFSNKNPILSDGIDQAYFTTDIIRDSYGNIVKDYLLVNVSTDLGSINSPDVRLDIPGHQIFVFNSILNFSILGGFIKGKANITINFHNGTAFGATQLTITSFPIGAIILHANITMIHAGTDNIFQITSDVIVDQFDDLILDGNLFTIQTTLGTIKSIDIDGNLPGIQIISQGGKISFLVEAGTLIGNLTFSATSCIGTAYGNGCIRVLSGYPYFSINLTCNYNTSIADNETIIQFFMDIPKDRWNNALDFEILYTLEIWNGSIINTDQNDLISGIQLWTVNYTLYFSCRVGTKSGLMIVKVSNTTFDIELNQTISLIGGTPASTITLKSLTTNLISGRYVTIQSSVITDKFGNVVPDGYLFTIIVSNGSISSFDELNSVDGIQIAIKDGIIKFEIQLPQLVSCGNGTITISVKSINGTSEGTISIEFFSEEICSPYPTSIFTAPLIYSLIGVVVLSIGVIIVRKIKRKSIILDYSTRDG